MTVKIASASPNFTSPVRLFIQADGAPVVHEFNATFRRVKASERTALAAKSLRELLDDVMVGWGGMKDENGRDVPYSHAERIATDDAYPGLEMAIAVSFWDHSMLNQREAAAKNSGAPSATS